MSGLVVTKESLYEITEQVWESYLSSDDPEFAALRPTHVRPVTGERFAAVSITGAWHGSVMVSCSPEGARRLAAALLDLPLPEITGVEVDDALGELANVIGGNVKALVPGPSTLSLPRLEGLTGLSAAGGDHACQVAMKWDDEPFTVAVLWAGNGDGERTA